MVVIRLTKKMVINITMFEKPVTIFIFFDSEEKILLKAVSVVFWNNKEHDNW